MASVAEYQHLLLTVLPLFEASETVPRLRHALPDAVPDAVSQHKLEKLSVEFRSEVVSLRLWLHRPHNFGACSTQLRKILKLFERLISDQIFSMKNPHMEWSEHPKLQILRHQIETMQEDDESTWGNLRRLVRFSTQEQKRYKALERITKYNDSLRHFDSTTYADLAGKERESGGGPTHIVRDRSLTLYRALASNWRCPCSSAHEAKLCLATHRSPERENQETNFDMLFSTDFMGRRWQEGRISVEDQRNPNHNRVKFESEQNTSISPLPAEILTICAIVKDAQNNGSRLHMVVDQEKLRPKRSLPTEYRNLEQQGTVSLKTMLGGKGTLTLTGKRILAVILANALLQLFETPWLAKQWNTEQICFFHHSGDQLEPCVTKPYLSTKFDEFKAGNTSQDIHRIHPIPSILALGVLLWEIELGRPIELARHDEDLLDGKPNINTDYTTVDRLLRNLRDDVYEGYWSAIDACLNCNFVQYNVGEQQINFNDRDFRQAVYESIVKPLEDELYDGFKISVRDLDQMSTELYSRCWKPRNTAFRQSHVAQVASPRPTTAMDARMENRIDATDFLGKNPVPSQSLQADPRSPTIGVLFDADCRMSSNESSSNADTWLERLRTEVHPEISRRPGPPAKIAILDSGIDMTHKEICSNKCRIMDFQDWTKSPPTPEVIDHVGHGTYNAALLFDVAPQAQIYVGKVFESMKAKRDTPEHVTKAILHAVEKWKVDIITMSFGFQDWDDEIANAIEIAKKHNVLVFAAASNDGANEEAVAFPARYDEAVISINASDGKGSKSRFNPPQTVESGNFSILGEAVESAWPTSLVQSGRRRLSGTSVATPIATGVAALILEFSSQPQRNIQYRNRLKTTRGMRRVLDAMAKTNDGYRYIRPWSLLKDHGDGKEIERKISLELKF